jgi:hypothetical protein
MLFPWNMLKLDLIWSLQCARESDVWWKSKIIKNVINKTNDLICKYIEDLVKRGWNIIDILLNKFKWLLYIF